MDVKGAVLLLATCYAADELATRALLQAGGRERMISKPAIRISLKIAVGALYLEKQKKSKLIRFGLPALYCGAGAWDGWQAHQSTQLRKSSRSF